MYWSNLNCSGLLRYRSTTRTEAVDLPLNSMSSRSIRGNIYFAVVATADALHGFFEQNETMYKLTVKRLFRRLWSAWHPRHLAVHSYFPWFGALRYAPREQRTEDLQRKFRLSLFQFTSWRDSPWTNTAARCSLSSPLPRCRTGRSSAVRRRWWPASGWRRTRSRLAPPALAKN